MIQTGTLYSFVPESYDEDGDRLGFSVNNKPAWADFDPNTGRLWGVPSVEDEGVSGGIVISVSDGRAGATLPAFSILVDEQADPGPMPPGASPPVIGGNPTRLAGSNELYLFQPTASDPDGDQLQFSVENLPSWLSFDPASGTINGIPKTGDIGIYYGIVIHVTDGLSSSSLGPFDIEVIAIGNRSVTLSWQAPTENEDGSPLLDLAGFRVQYGNQSGVYPNLVDINNPGITTFALDNLVPATYYFVLTAYNSRGVNSTESNEMMLTLN